MTIHVTSKDETIKHIVKHSGHLWYVDASIAASGDGTRPDNGFKTITEAITACDAGDAITIGTGTYVEDVVLDKNSVKIWCEQGVILDGTGTCLTVSGNNCKINTLDNSVKVTPASGQIGVVISGEGFVGKNIRVGCSTNNSADCYQLSGGGAVLRQCRASGMGATYKGFNISSNGNKLYDCSTTGTTTSYGYYLCGTISRGVLVNCTSAGHQTSGFHLCTGVSLMTILNCSSGADDGRWVDTDNANVWSKFSYDAEVSKLIDFTDETQAFDLFTITGQVEIEFVHGDVTEALNAEFGNCKFRIHGTDGTTNLDFTTATSCNSLPVGSFIGKVQDASEALRVVSSAAPAIIEVSTFKSPRISSILVADNTGTTTLQFYSADSSGNKDGKVLFKCKWSPVSDNGFVSAS